MRPGAKGAFNLAAASEEMASASEELSRQAEQLQHTIAFFEVANDGGLN